MKRKRKIIGLIFAMVICFCLLPETVLEADNSKISIVNEVSDQSVYVGQTVTYTAKSTVPDTTGYTEYQFIVSDQMDAGLTFDGLSSIEVRFGETFIGVPYAEYNTTLEEITDSNGAVIGFRLKFDMTKYQDYVGEQITITYTATVNEKAVAVSTNNYITLVHSDDPQDETSTEQKTDSVPVYSAKIVVDKYNGSDETKKLSGATFVLYKYDTDGSTEMFYSYNAGKVEWIYGLTGAAVYTTDNSGAAEFIGLEDGVYYLRETEAPTGFEKIPSDVKITVDAVETILNSATELTDAEIKELLSVEAEAANYSGYYTVTWLDENGSALETDTNVGYGTTPSYDGNTPTKETDNTYIYTFSGWLPEVDAIIADTTYKAVYSKTYVAPAAGEGYTIDYSGETAMAVSGYEISTEDGSTWSSGTLTVTPGGTLYVRRAADLTASASAATANTLSSRPSAPSVTAVDEVWYGENNGQITGVTTTMEYSADGSTWTTCTGTTVDGLAAETYYVHYKATDSAFTSEAACVTINSGTERTYTLSVTAPTFDVVTYGYTQLTSAGITIASTGNSDATISSVALSGANADSFMLNKTEGTTIAAGTTDNTTYTIQPKDGLSAGTYTATVTVTYNGGATAAADVSFTVNKANRSVFYSEDPVTKHINDDVFINALTQTTIDGTISYTSSDTAVAAVDAASGEVTIVGAGSATITATAASTENYNEATASYTLTVTDHSWNSGAVTTAATCTTVGVMTYTCTACGETRTETIAATGHSLTHVEEKAATCTDNGNIEYWYCKTCGKYFSNASATQEITWSDIVISPTGHVDGDERRENEVAATDTADGSYDRVIYCSECGAELVRETITVPATGQSSTAAAESDAPLTGDDKQIALWAGLVILSAGLVIILLTRRRDSEQNG